MKKIFIIAIVSTITATSLIISSCNGGSSNKADIDKVAAIYNEGIEQIKNAKDKNEADKIFDEVGVKTGDYVKNNIELRTFFAADDNFF